jgi:PmbA protein
MNKLIQAAEKSLQYLKANGASHSVVTGSIIESCEFNVESNKLNLIRTTFDQFLKSKVFIDQKVGTSSDNQLDDESLISLANKTIETAKASISDEANIIATNQGLHDFKNQILEEQDSEWMNDFLSGFITESNQLFPKTIIEGATIKFNKEEKILLSSEGSRFTSKQTYYDGFVMFTSKDGKKTSSFNYVGFLKNKDDVKLMETSDLRNLLKQSNEQIHLMKVPGKFTGEIIITPACMSEFTSSILDYISTDKLLQKQSFLQGKQNELVASQFFSLKSNPTSSEFAHHHYWTEDGYLTNDEIYFENGILKNYLINDYGAKKLSLPRSHSSGSNLVLRPGHIEFFNMVKSIKKGLLVCRFAGGHPAKNGDFSGIAKNSYYIENGEILFPVSEVMISGNLSSLIKNISGVSKETIHLGHAIFPWVQVSDIVIS